MHTYSNEGILKILLQHDPETITSFLSSFYNTFYSTCGGDKILSRNYESQMSRSLGRMTGNILTDFTETYQTIITTIVSQRLEAYSTHVSSRINRDEWNSDLVIGFDSWRFIMLDTCIVEASWPWKNNWPIRDPMVYAWRVKIFAYGFFCDMLNYQNSSNFTNLSREFQPFICDVSRECRYNYQNLAKFTGIVKIYWVVRNVISLFVKMKHDF